MWPPPFMPILLPEFPKSSSVPTQWGRIPPIATSTLYPLWKCVPMINSWNSGFRWSVRIPDSSSYQLCSLGGKLLNLCFRFFICKIEIASSFVQFFKNAFIMEIFKPLQNKQKGTINLHVPSIQLQHLWIHSPSCFILTPTRFLPYSHFLKNQLYWGMIYIN